MTLRNFGLGKKNLDQHIKEEAHHLVEVIKEDKGGHSTGRGWEAVTLSFIKQNPPKY